MGDVLKLFEQLEDHSSLKAVDPDQFPTDMEHSIEKANEYALSFTGKKPKLFSKSTTVNGKEQKTEYKQICNYSGKYQREESLSIWCENIELYFLGSGYPMYFDFMKSCMLVLFLIFISSGSFNIFSNAFTGTDCQDDEVIKEMIKKGKKVKDICQLSWTTLLSLANKRNDTELIFLQDVMNLITVFTIICVLQYLRTNQRALNEQCDELLISPSDYTVWIKGIPAYGNDISIEDSIRADMTAQIEQHHIEGNEENRALFEIVNITVCYKLEKINALMDQRAAVIEKLRKFKLIPGTTEVEGKSERELEVELDQVKKDIMAKKRQYYDGVDKQNNADFTGHAFVTLNTEKAKNLLIASQKSGCCSCFSANKQIQINGETTDIFQAPEPTDVNWNFLETSPYQQKVRNIISNAITFFLLLISFIIIMLLLRIQQSGSTTTIVLDKKGKQQAVTMTASDWTVKALALIISLVIPMLNYILQLCLTKLSIFERHHRKTNEIASLGQKLAWTQFINTAIITFTIKVLFDFFTDRQQAEDNIYMAGGLIYNQQYVFITNSLIAAASIAVDGGRLYKIINRNFLAKKNTMTQRQLNTLYEEPEHNLAFDYSGLMKTMLFTAFYAPLIPLGIILSIVGIAVLYFIQKYKIMNHRTIRYSMSNQISLEMIELMEYILPVYCLANMIYEYIMVREAQVSWFSLLGITLGILNIALPMDSFNEALFYVKSCPDLTEKYEDNIHNFQFDYDRANPATDDYARKLYIEQEVKGVNTYGLNNPGTLFAKF